MIGEYDVGVVGATAVPACYGTVVIIIDGYSLWRRLNWRAQFETWNKSIILGLANLEVNKTPSETCRKPDESSEIVAFFPDFLLRLNINQTPLNWLKTTSPLLWWRFTIQTNKNKPCYYFATFEAPSTKLIAQSFRDKDGEYWKAIKGLPFVQNPPRQGVYSWEKGLRNVSEFQISDRLTSSESI